MDFAKKKQKTCKRSSILLVNIRKPLSKKFQKAKNVKKYAALIPSMKKDA